MICPNRNTQEWKDLVRELGNEVDAMYAFTVNGEEIPTIVKAKQILSKVKSNEDIRDLEYKHKLRNPNSGRLYVKSYEDAMAKSAELNQDLRGYKAEVTKVRFGEAPNYKEGYGVHIVETTTAIKEGVDFVFEQNPKLADSVYEALGFKTNITQDNKSYYRGQIEQPTIDKNGNLVLYAKEDELYKRAGLKSKGVSMTDDLKSAIDYGNGQLEVARNLASESYDAEQELDRLLENGYYLIQIPKNISNEVVKEAGEVKVIGNKIVVPKGQYKIEQVIDDVEIQITSQQKQQAQQLYSQYLDTIFPDSKVKDIIYHGGSKTFEQFRIDSENRASGTSQIKKGVYFSRSKNVAKGYVQSKEGITSNALNIILNNVEKSLGLREYDVYGSKEDGYTYEEEEYKKPSEVISKLEKLYGKLTKNNLYFFSEEGLSDYSYMNQLKDFENLNIDSLIDAMRTDDIKKIKSIISEYNTTNKDTSKLYSVVVNLKNPTIISNKETVPIYNSLIGKESLINKAESIIVENVYDSVEGNMGEPSDTIIVFEPEQIHILGSKQDLQGFKEFIKGNYPEQGQIIEISKKFIETISEFNEEFGESYWKDTYLNRHLSNYYEFRDITIPTVKNKFKYDIENVYHGTNFYQIDKEGNLILKPSENFGGKTNSVSFTAVPVVAQDYMLRKNGNIIIKINNKAIPNNYIFESHDEISINQKNDIVIPKGSFQVLIVDTISNTKKQEYNYIIEGKKNRMLSYMKTPEDVINTLVSALNMISYADQYLELKENLRYDYDAPKWYLSSEQLQGKTGQEVLKEIEKTYSVDELTKIYSDYIRKSIFKRGIYDEYSHPSVGNQVYGMGSLFENPVGFKLNEKLFKNLLSYDEISKLEEEYTGFVKSLDVNYLDHIIAQRQNLDNLDAFRNIEIKDSNLEELNKVEKNDTLEEAKQDILRDFEKYYPQYADLTIQEREIMIDMMSDGEINTYC